MSKCPNCGHKLHIYNISQKCPNCGVNMLFCGFAENFYREAKTAELTQAGVHVKIKRLKASFLGSRLTIARLIAVLLPVVALLIPSGEIIVNLPFHKFSYDISVFGVVGIVTDNFLPFLLSMKDSLIYGSEFGAVFVSLLGFAVVAVFCVICLLLTVLCFLSCKNMQKIICVFSGLGFVSGIADFIIILSSRCTEGIVNIHSGFGVLVSSLMFGVVFVINLILSIKGIPVEYGEGMLERVEIYKQVKAGKINIDDLPQPVVETEETRKIQAEIEKEEERFKQKHAKEGNGNG